MCHRECNEAICWFTEGAFVKLTKIVELLYGSVYLAKGIVSKITDCFVALAMTRFFSRFNHKISGLNLF
jgi:glucokinase